MRHDNAWPASPDAITPGWIGDALSRAGLLRDGASVAGIDAAPILDLGGVNGDVSRLRPRYTAVSAGAPGSLIAKFAPDNPAARGVARYQRWYEREVRFYRELAASSPIGTPRSYAAELDADDRYVLLLEDLAPHEQGDQVAGCTPPQATRAVEAVATLHARWWGDPSLHDHPWLPLTTVGLDRAGAIQGAVARGWQSAAAAGLLPASTAGAGDRFIEAYPSLLERIARPPRTVVHGDYRLDNLFFDRSTGDVRVIDWQFCCRARGTYDVGYFIGLNLEPDERAEHEERLLARYVEILQQRGVGEYGIETCREDYRTTLLLGLAVFLIGAAGEQPNERMRRVHETGIHRLVRAVEETGAIELL